MIELRDEGMLLAGRNIGLMQRLCAEAGMVPRSGIATQEKIAHVRASAFANVVANAFANVNAKSRETYAVCD